jgi:hypothetical protein
LEDIVTTTVGKSKTILYDVRYLLPDGSYKLLRKKNIHHHPGAWVNPDPPPRVAILGEGHSCAPASDRQFASIESIFGYVHNRDWARVAPPGRKGPPSAESDDSSVVLRTLYDGPLPGLLCSR